MKYLLISFIILMNIVACSSKKENKIEDIDPCLPGYILIVYIGENSAPVPPILLRTDKDDLKYHQFIGGGQEMHIKNDFIISESLEKYYMAKFKIRENDFNALKHYIINHNTNRTKIEKNEDYSKSYPIKIILSDQCDSISYIIYNTDNRYFDNFLDSTNLKNNEKLIEVMNYYK